ncbi:MAG: winged helix-turn-helix domain-containing protein [Candidatus Diapherotrites archaeon]
MVFEMSDSNEVKFDQSELKVLASPTRVEILKNLKSRNYTVSELAQKLGHSKSTMHEHLELLMKANLVEKADNYTDKWVYYRLSRRGKELFADSGKRIVVVISSVLLAFGIMLLALSFLPAIFPQTMQESYLIAGKPSDTVTGKQFKVQSTPEPEMPLGANSEKGIPSADTTSALTEQPETKARAIEFPWLLALGITLIVAAFIVGQKYRLTPEKMFLEKKKGKKMGFERKQ